MYNFHFKLGFSLSSEPNIWTRQSGIPLKRENALTKNITVKHDPPAVSSKIYLVQCFSLSLCTARCFYFFLLLFFPFFTSISLLLLLFSHLYFSYLANEHCRGLCFIQIEYMAVCTDIFYNLPLNGLLQCV